jgi:hypothetical protein
MRDGIYYTEEEIEETRVEEIPRKVDKMDATLGEIRNQYLNEIGYQESLHTSHIIREMVESYLLEHPTIIFDQLAYQHAFNAHTALFNLYQRIGYLQYQKQNPTETP